MPDALPRACRVKTCPKVTKNKFGYCDDCAKKWWKEYEQKRDKKSHAFYQSVQWKTLRAYKLAHDPLCEECKRHNIIKEAEHVDHINPVSNGGAALELSNLQSLCKPCHSQKTAREIGRKTQYGTQNIN